MYICRLPREGGMTFVVAPPPPDRKLMEWSSSGQSPLSFFCCLFLSPFKVLIFLSIYRVKHPSLSLHSLQDLRPKLGLYNNSHRFYMDVVVVGESSFVCDADNKKKEEDETDKLLESFLWKKSESFPSNTRNRRRRFLLGDVDFEVKTLFLFTVSDVTRNGGEKRVFYYYFQFQIL